MSKWIPTAITNIFGIAGYLVERGLDMAGITISLQWAIFLWVISGFLLLAGFVMLFKWYLIPFMKRIRISLSPTPNSEDLASRKHEYVPDTYIRGRITYLIDLLVPGAQPIISGRTIEDCEIRGPAMIALLGGTTITSGTFDGDIGSLFVEVVDKRYILGAIGLQDCVFRRCRFVAIGIIGTREQFEMLKQAFTPSTSHKEDFQK